MCVNTVKSPQNQSWLTSLYLTGNLPPSPFTVTPLKTYPLRKFHVRGTVLTMVPTLFIRSPELLILKTGLPLPHCWVTTGVSGWYSSGTTRGGRITWEVV